MCWAGLRRLWSYCRRGRRGYGTLSGHYLGREAAIGARCRLLQCENDRRRVRLAASRSGGASKRLTDGAEEGARRRAASARRRRWWEEGGAVVARAAMCARVCCM